MLLMGNELKAVCPGECQGHAGTVRSFKANFVSVVSPAAFKLNCHLASLARWRLVFANDRLPWYAVEEMAGRH